MEAFRQLEQWVHEQAATLPHGSLLPADRSLAASFGISRSTVRRVMQRLATGEVVTRLKGKGTMTGRVQAGGITGPLKRDPAAERIAERLRQRIGRGELRHGKPLPLYKNLCADYQASPNTVTAALNLLAREGIISRQGRHHVVGEVCTDTSSTAAVRVLCLFPQATDLRRLFTTHGYSLCLRKMETEFIRTGLRLEFDTLERLPALAERWRRTGGAPAGMLWGGEDMLIQDPVTLKPSLAVLRALRTANAAPRVCVLTLSLHTDDDGVFYFSMSHADTVLWRRIAAYAQSRQTAAVTVFLSRHEYGVAHFIQSMRLIAEIDHALPGLRPRFVIRPGTFITNRGTLLEQIYAMLPKQAIDARLSKYRPITLDSHEDDFVRTEDFTPFYTGSNPSPTLWVFDRDSDAAEALDACRSRRRRVPGDIAIISVDNDPAGYTFGLSACVRDWESMGYLIAHTVLGDIPLQFTSRGFVDYDVLFIERGTT